MTANQVLAVVRLLIVVGVLLVIYRQRCSGQNILLGVPIILWMAHICIYLTAYLVISSIGPTPTQLFNVWSASLQIHGYLTILYMEIARYYRQRGMGANGC